VGRVSSKGRRVLVEISWLKMMSKIKEKIAGTMIPSLPSNWLGVNRSVKKQTKIKPVYFVCNKFLIKYAVNKEKRI